MLDKPSEIFESNRLGRKFYMYRHDIMHTGKILDKGPYQKQNLVALRKLVPHAQKIIDAGMNVGMNTIEYSTFADEVHGFEPIPHLYETALKNLRINKNHTALENWFEKIDPNANMTCSGKMFAYPYGLSNKEETLKFLDREDHNSGLSSVDWFDRSTRSGKARNQKRKYRRRKIKSYPLDDFNFEKVDAIKVDTEGYDMQVLQGAEKTIDHQRPVVQVETIKGQPDRFGYTCQDILDWFMNKDYDVYLSDGTKVNGTWQWYKHKMDRFFVPREMNVEGFAKNE